MRYLAAEEILVIHSKIVEKTGGAHGVRDVGLLASSASRPQMEFGGKELYKGLFAKAGAYIDSLAKHHVFIDGNKRTALSVAGVFLALNGYQTTFPIKASERFVLAAAQRQRTLEEIATWLKTCSRKMRK